MSRLPTSAAVLVLVCGLVACTGAGLEPIAGAAAAWMDGAWGPSGAPPLAAAQAAPADDVARKLMDPCPDCRGKQLSGCDCGAAAEMKVEIARLLAEGRTEEEILALFVERHGEWILAAPAKRGFNLVGYLLPFGLLLAGAGGIALFLRRAVRRTADPQVTPQPSWSLAHGRDGTGVAPGPGAAADPRVERSQPPSQERDHRGGSGAAPAGSALTGSAPGSQAPARPQSALAEPAITADERERLEAELRRLEA